MPASHDLISKLNIIADETSIQPREIKRPINEENEDFVKTKLGKALLMQVNNFRIDHRHLGDPKSRS